LDPPFNSNADYNILYGTKRGVITHPHFQRADRGRGC